MVGHFTWVPLNMFEGEILEFQEPDTPNFCQIVPNLENGSNLLCEGEPEGL